MFGSDGENEAIEAQKQNQDHNRAATAAFNDETNDTQYLREVTDTELSHETLEIVSNLLSKDFVLANLDDAEMHELRWLARIVKLEIESQHPNDDSMWQGRFREVASGGDSRPLEALTEREQTDLFNVIQGVIMRASRSKGGWQQEEISKSYAVSERRENDDDDGGWL
jgi:hypothetical protein